ncbi:hypothetical protein Tco_0611683 [Tanacetum coccineum]
MANCVDPDDPWIVLVASDYGMIQHWLSTQGLSFKTYAQAQQPTGRKFQLEHCWRILKGHSKWDAPKPLDTEDHTEIFGPDVRPRPAGKNRPAKKTKSETTGSTGGSASGDEERKKKDNLLVGGDDGFKEMGFSTIDVDLTLPEMELKRAIIEKRQEKIFAKYAQQ